eukprot:1310939-Amphidinium_carterae.1
MHDSNVQRLRVSGAASLNVAEHAPWIDLLHVLAEACTGVGWGTVLNATEQCWSWESVMETWDSLTAAMFSSSLGRPTRDALGCLPVVDYLASQSIDSKVQRASELPLSLSMARMSSRAENHVHDCGGHLDSNVARDFLRSTRRTHCFLLVPSAVVSVLCPLLPNQLALLCPLFPSPQLHQTHPAPHAHCAPVLTARESALSSSTAFPCFHHTGATLKLESPISHLKRRTFASDGQSQFSIRSEKGRQPNLCATLRLCSKI